MLVLSRKRGEQIVIGENIKLTVVAVHGGRVKLGVCAPQDVSIQRKEVHARPCPDRQSDNAGRSPSDSPG